LGVLLAFKDTLERNRIRERNKPDDIAEEIVANVIVGGGEAKRWSDVVPR
jgi:hypothetical protein